MIVCITEHSSIEDMLISDITKCVHHCAAVVFVVQVREVAQDSRTRTAAAEVSIKQMLYQSYCAHFTHISVATVV
jgi:hypothetical protein